MIMSCSFRAEQRRAFSARLLALGLVLAAASGCALSKAPLKSLSTSLANYPETVEPLKIARLTVTVEVPDASRGKAVTIIVHPAYSLFFRDERKNRYSGVKHDLLKLQLEDEARFLSMAARTDNLVILVLPGNYQRESVAPLSYVSYLNSVVGGSTTVFYVYSETSSSGILPPETLVTLYSFLRSVGADTVLVGGGYIGRCQDEFYAQMSTYLGSVAAYVVPELSAISPDDISEKDSLLVLNSIRRRDYAPVRDFIDKRTNGSAVVLHVPQSPR